MYRSDTVPDPLLSNGWLMYKVTVESRNGQDTAEWKAGHTVEWTAEESTAQWLEASVVDDSTAGGGGGGGVAASGASNSLTPVM